MLRRVRPAAAAVSALLVPAGVLVPLEDCRWLWESVRDRPALEPRGPLRARREDLSRQLRAAALVADHVIDRAATSVPGAAGPLTTHALADRWHVGPRQALRVLGAAGMQPIGCAGRALLWPAAAADVR